MQIRIALEALAVAQSCEREERRYKVDASRQRVRGPGAAHIGMPHEERNPHRLLVDVRALAEHAPMRAGQLTVIGCGENDRVTVKAEPFNGPEHGADVLIDV